jgi:hypothetical protein
VLESHPGEPGVVETMAADVVTLVHRATRRDRVPVDAKTVGEERRRRPVLRQSVQDGEPWFLGVAVVERERDERIGLVDPSDRQGTVAADR